MVEKVVYPDLAGTSNVGQNVKKFLHLWYCAAENWFEDAESLTKVYWKNSDDNRVVRSVKLLLGNIDNKDDRRNLQPPIRCPFVRSLRCQFPNKGSLSLWTRWWITCGEPVVAVIMAVLMLNMLKAFHIII